MSAEFDKKPIVLQSRSAPWMQRLGQRALCKMKLPCQQLWHGHLVMPGAAGPLMYPIIRLTECPKNLLPPLAWTPDDEFIMLHWLWGRKSDMLLFHAGPQAFFSADNRSWDEQSDSIEPCPREGPLCWANKRVYLLNTYLLLVCLRSHATQLTFHSLLI